MTVNHHIEQFHGLPVFDFVQALDEAADAGDAAAVPLPEPASAAWRIGLHYDSEEAFTERWRQFLDTVDTERVTAVVIGPWFSDEPEQLDAALAAIVEAAGRLPALRGLFVGDVTYEESEISWLEMCDVTPLLTAYPELTELVVRGGSNLELTPVRHEALRALRFEAGGLPAAVVRAVAGCDFPVLERLELWLGVDNYGGDATLSDLAPSWTARASPRCAIWACRTASSRTPSRPPWRTRRWWPGWSRSASPWAC